MEAATQNDLIEELSLSGFASIPVGHFAQFFPMNRNIKRLEIRGISVGGGETATTTAVAHNNTMDNALQTLRIEGATHFTEDAARKFIHLVLHPSNQNLVELELSSHGSLGTGSVQFDNDNVVAPTFFRALLEKPTIKRLGLLDYCSTNHFEIIMNASTKIEAFSVKFDRSSGKAKMVTLTRTLSKMKHLLELNLAVPYHVVPLYSEEDKNNFVRSVEQHTNLTTVTLQDAGNRFTPAQQQKLRTFGNRNVMLRELICASNKLNTPAPPQVPHFLATCHDCPAAALALLVSRKDKVGPPESQKRMGDA